MTDLAHQRPVANEPDQVRIPDELLEAADPPSTNGHEPEPPVVAADPQVAPHDLQAEESLLGAMLLSAAAIDAVDGHVTAGDFYKPAHQHIHEAIVALHRDGLPADAVTVCDQLRLHGLLDTVGGPAVLAGIMATTPAISNAAAYAQIVARHAHARRIVHAGTEAARAARGGALDQAQLFLEMGSLTPRVASVETPTLTEFLDHDEPDHVWAIPDLIETTDRLLLTGPEGGGKSVLLRQIAVQAAAGIHPFTHEPIPPQRVLLLDLENSARHVRREIRPLHLAAHGNAGDNLRIASLPAGLDLTDRDDAQLLEALVDTSGAQLVCGGPVYKLVGGDPTEERPAKAAAMLIDRLRDRYETAWMLETHQPHETNGKRPDRPYGASLWKRWPEFGLHLAANGQLRHWRGDRDQRAWPPALIRGGLWPWSPAPKKDAEFARAVELCRNKGRLLSYAELGAELGTSKASAARLVTANKEAWSTLERELAEL